ncbi:MAG: hypothetical protein AABX11_06080 [Nanoarchaeota archaeon]
MKNTKLSSKDKILLNEIIEDATVDCNDEDEQLMGWACVFEEKICVPCKCLIGKHEAILKEVEQAENAILGLITIGKVKIRTPIEDIQIEDGKIMKYVEAYKYWRKNG